MLGRISGTKEQNAIGIQRKVHNGEIHNLSSLDDQIKGDEMGRCAACLEEIRNEYKISVKSLKEIDHSDDLNVDKDILK